MKKKFTNAAEELIKGIPSGIAEDTDFSGNRKSSGGYMRYVEPRSERMNLLLSKSLVKKLAAEAKKRKMSRNGIVNEILESYFSNNK